MNDYSDDRVLNQRNRRPWVMAVAAAAIGTAVTVTTFAMLNGSTNNSPDAAPTVRGTPEVAVSKAVPVYWLGKTIGFRSGPGVRLYRTFIPITGSPGLEAVRLMTSPTATMDPDYSSPWTGAMVSSVSQSPGLITVDFQQFPRQKLKPAVAEIAVQQLIYTVQGAMGSTAPVLITEAGQPSAALFGVVDTHEPTSRAAADDVQAYIWIHAPLNGARTAPPLKVTGIAAVNEAQLNWQVKAAGTTKVVARGTARTTEAFKLTPYSFTVDLPQGKYELEVFESSAEDGRATSTDTKTITVR